MIGNIGKTAKSKQKKTYKQYCEFTKSVFLFAVWGCAGLLHKWYSCCDWLACDMCAHFCLTYIMRYCALVPRSSNDSQTHLKFCFAKGVCSHMNHVLTYLSSKMLRYCLNNNYYTVNFSN